MNCITCADRGCVGECRFVPALPETRREQQALSASRTDPGAGNTNGDHSNHCVECARFWTEYATAARTRAAAEDEFHQRRFNSGSEAALVARVEELNGVQMDLREQWAAHYAEAHRRH